MPAQGGPRRRQSSEWLATSAAIMALWAAWLLHQGMATTRPPEPTSEALTAPVAEEQIRLAEEQNRLAEEQIRLAEEQIRLAEEHNPLAEPAHTKVTAPTAPKPLQYSRPVQLAVPALRIASRLTTVGISADGSLGAPPTTQAKLAGWYRRGVAPGEQGTAVIVGHVDTKTGPAVFYGLATLRPHDSVEVTRADGTIAVFTVDGIRVYSKNGFPAARVLAPTGRPELRLVTCGGGYSEETGYTANVVVYAHLTGTKRPA